MSHSFVGGHDHHKTSEVASSARPMSSTRSFREPWVYENALSLLDRAFIVPRKIQAHPTFVWLSAPVLPGDPALPGFDASAGELRGSRASARCSDPGPARGAHSHRARPRAHRRARPLARRGARPRAHRGAHRGAHPRAHRRAHRRARPLARRCARPLARPLARRRARPACASGVRTGERVRVRVGVRIGVRVRVRLGVRIGVRVGERRRRIRLCIPLGPPQLDPAAVPRSSQCVRPSAIRTGAATNSLRATHDPSAGSDPSTR